MTEFDSKLEAVIIDELDQVGLKTDRDLIARRLRARIIAEAEAEASNREEAKREADKQKPTRQMQEYDQVEEFKARFESLTKHVGNAMSEAAHFGARMLCDFPDDEACVEVGEQLGKINQMLADIYTELHELPNQLY